MILRGLTIVIVVLCFSGGSSCFGQFDHLLKYLPDNTNALYLLNTEKIFQSDLAKKQDFAKRYDELRNEMPLAMPPDAKRFILAANMNLSRVQPDSETVIVELTQDRKIETIAKATGGTIDEIAGKQCVVVGDIYIVQFSDRVVGAMWPSDRQHIAQWIRIAKRRTEGRLSPYLKKAIAYTRDVGTEAILALDLTDSLPPSRFREALKRSKSLSGTDVNRNTLVDLLTSIEGVILGVKVTDKLNGRLKVDFGRDALPLKPFAQKMLLEALANTGSMIDEFEEWEPVVKKNEVSIRGTLTESGVRKILSLMSVDTSGVAVENKDDDNTPDLVSDLATSKYVATIEKRLGDLFNADTSTSTLRERLLWVQNYARGIDRLSSRNVNRKVRKDGKSIADMMAEIVKVVQDASVRTAKRASKVVPDAKIKVGGEPRNRYTTSRGRFYTFDPTFSMKVNVKTTSAEYKKIYDEEMQEAAARVSSIEAKIKETLAQMKAIANKQQ